MSKHYTNYNKYNNPNKPKDVVENAEPAITPATPVDPDETTVVTPEETTAAPVVADPVEPEAIVVTPEETTAPVTVTDPEPTPKVIIGVVSNCKKLNVRADADMDAKIITVINAGDEVVVRDLDGNDEWLEVHSIEGEPGTVGFHGVCVKKYITVEQ